MNGIITDWNSAINWKQLWINLSLTQIAKAGFIVIMKLWYFFPLNKPNKTTFLKLLIQPLKRHVI